MIYKIDKDNMDLVTNLGLKADAGRYEEMYQGFLKAVEDSGVKISDKDRSSETACLMNKLKEKGAKIRSFGKSVLWGNISPSCEDCRTGAGSSTYILTLACNRDCFFCTNKNQADYDGGTAVVYDVVRDFKHDLAFFKRMTSTALTGGEPLLYPDKCTDFIRQVKKSSKKIQTRIYTNGDLATPEILAELEKAGLDEIRFGIKLDANGLPEERTLEHIREAVKHIPRVMVEMPVVPGTLPQMKELMKELDSIGIFGANILEFLYPWINPGEYSGRGYEITRRPYDVLFGYTYAGGLPVAGSQEECLELLLFCAEQNMKMGVHYCSLENKLTSQIYGQNSVIRLNGTEYFSDKDFFIKTLKGYGDDIDKIKEVLDENGCEHYIYNKSDGFIEFSPKFAEYLKDMEMELGLSYRAADIDEKGRKVLLELRIDMIKPSDFSIDEI